MQGYSDGTSRAQGAPPRSTHALRALPVQVIRNRHKPRPNLKQIKARVRIQKTRRVLKFKHLGIGCGEEALVIKSKFPLGRSNGKFRLVYPNPTTPLPSGRQERCP